MATTKSWKDLIIQEMSAYGETWADIVSITLTENEAVKPFETGNGMGPNGSPFTAWSANRVYFPLCYDGDEWCGSAPRAPNDEAMKHQGG